MIIWALLALLLIEAPAASVVARSGPGAGDPIEAPAVALGVGELHASGITGAGVTVAVIDSGLAPLGGGWRRQANGSLLRQSAGGQGFIIYRDFVAPTGADSSDPNGHGTHVIGTIANRRPLKSSGTGAMGVAPGVNLVVARALDAEGAADYATVIAAIDWVIAQRETYAIRVLNLSLYAPVAGPYWADPLARAVMRAWQAGIVVVTAAGNAGPGPATITVPGNVPYVISVGALRSARFNPSGSDELAGFSSRGPTESAFAKPDLLAPAVRVIAPIPDASVLASAAVAGRLEEKAKLRLGSGQTNRDVGYYQLSGSSMAAAEISGLAALLLQAQPALRNDQVKHRLMATARLARDTSGAAAYSIWEQGAGLVQALAAVRGNSTAAANAGLDLTRDLDLASDFHPWGLTSYDPASGRFSLPALSDTPAGYLVWAGAGRAWAGALSWSGDPEVWAGAGRAWSGAGRAWAGAGRAWAGSAELWAGAGRAWAGAQPPTPSSHTAADLEAGDQQIYLPLLQSP